MSRAYAALRDSGYAHATQGAGTFTAVPGGRERAHDRVLAPKGVGEDWIDLNCTADSAPADVMSAYTVSVLPSHLERPRGAPDDGAHQFEQVGTYATQIPAARARRRVQDAGAG